MSRNYCYIAILTIIFVVRSSEAVNCTTTSFQQDLDATEVAASKTIAADYANSTKAQIVANLMKQFNNSVVSFDYTVTQNGSTISIKYQIIFACNETSTTVLPDGTKSTTEVKSQVNKTQLEKSVSCGL
jgi:hypothetical protein